MDNLKEQLRLKFQRMKKNNSRPRRNETILNNSMEVKQKESERPQEKIKRIKKSCTSINVTISIIVKIFLEETSRSVFKRSDNEKQVQG